MPELLDRFESALRIINQITHVLNACRKRSCPPISHVRVALLRARAAEIGGDRGGTGEDCTMDVVVCPWTRNRSSTRSRDAIAGKWTLRMKQSSPVTRWHSTTSGIC